ncbi:uncharacterized protein LOC123316576 isoform X2 [Coccinella septempunctata]|uniref:uncharacterized protein LOC123316576 isoform X2 n=1 Tax=Coccinella septempunctata TaxID=41139 RepID=UPI001D07E8E4|nr:uncharacterized protein LOC123316576 isoform X2 [Coccinella septempunctata]
MRNVVENLEEINMKKNICLIPALLEEVEMLSFLSSKKHKDRTSNSFIARASDRNVNRSFPSSLQGRTEIHPRRNRQHQIQEFSSAKSSRGRRQDNHEFFDQLQFDPNRISSHKLLKRVEKSAERIVRGITIRNLESVKRIGASNPKLIVRVFEKYLSEVLNCNAKLLLGRKNLGLISYEDYLMESGSKIQDLNLTYYMNIENPFSCLIYPSLIEGCGNKNKMSISSECGDKQSPEDNKMKCNCKQKNTCCHCKPAKTPPTNEVKKNCGCTKDGKSFDNRGSRSVSKPAGNTRTSFKISDMKLGGQMTSVQKINEQSAELKENCKMDPTVSSLTSGNGMKIKRKCDCQRKSTMQTIGEGEATVKRCGCAKKKTGGHSSGRSRSGKSKSKKHKCDCTEPCEPKTAITAEGDHQPKKASCECVPDLKINNDAACNPACSSHNSGPRCPCPCRALLKMKSVKEGYISADPYGEKEDKRFCVCQPNSRIMKNMAEEPDVLPKETPCGVCDADKENPSHKCDICELVEGLGTHPDENASMATIASSDFDQIASILRDTRNDNKLLSNIKCFRNSSGIICQSELVGCPVNGDKGGKCKTNTIEIRIKYPNKTEKYKDISCSAVCTNTNSSKMAGGKRAKDERYCEFVENLQQEISACCAQPDKSDLSMLLDSFARSVPEKGERRSSCLKSTTFDDRAKGSCSFKTDEISCQTSNCEGVQNDEMDVECIFRRGQDCSPLCGDESLCSKRKSSDSLDDWGFEEDKKEIQIGECSKDSCMRLVHQPVIAKTKKAEVECDVKGSCIREKIFEKLFSNEKQPCKVPSKTCETPIRRASQDKKASNSKASPKNKVASKSSSKNITKPQDKAATGKKNDTMKLDEFDQNILARALDAFLSKGK